MVEGESFLCFGCSYVVHYCCVETLFCVVCWQVWPENLKVSVEKVFYFIFFVEFAAEVFSRPPENTAKENNQTGPNAR